MDVLSTSLEDTTVHWFGPRQLVYNPHMGKITDKTKLVPASPGRIDITAPFVSTDLSTGETTLFWLYETRIINGETEEAEIVATQTFGDWHALRKFGTALIDSIEERKPTT